MEKCFQEAVRYLGYGKNPVDEATSRLVEKGFLELEKVSALRSEHYRLAAKALQET